MPMPQGGGVAPNLSMAPGGYDAWQATPYGDHNNALSGSLGFSQADLQRHNPTVSPDMLARSQAGWAMTGGAMGPNGVISGPNARGMGVGHYGTPLDQIGDRSGLVLDVGTYGGMDNFMGKGDLDAQSIVDQMAAGKIPYPKGYDPKTNTYAEGMQPKWDPKTGEILGGGKMPPPRGGEITKRGDEVRKGQQGDKQRRQQEEEKKRRARGGQGGSNY
jgi:hypothetical protein